MEKLNKLVTITISIIISVFSVLFILNDKKEFSENEFRYLETFPTFSVNSFIDGKYISSLDSFLTDHFPFRDSFVELKTSLYYLSGQRLINNVYIADNDYLINKYDRGENADKIINIINKFKENNQNINMYMLLSPTASSIYSNYLPANSINDSEKESIDYYYERLNIDTIDIYDSLLKEKDNYQLFYKTDHHWTSYGAYFAYKEFCLANNIIPYELNDFKIKLVSNNFYGTLYSKIFYNKVKPDNIYSFSVDDNMFTVNYLDKETDSLYSEKYLEEKDKYSYFLDNNQPIIKITNNSIDNNKEILIIKDSYANSFIPLLANNYKKIHVIDPRYYNMPVSDYIKSNNIENVLFLYNINSIDNDLGIIGVR